MGYSETEYRVAAEDFAAASEGDFSIDEDAPVAKNAEGAYVQVWVLIRDDELTKGECNGTRS